MNTRTVYICAVCQESELQTNAYIYQDESFEVCPFCHAVEQGRIEVEAEAWEMGRIVEVPRV